MFNRAFKMKNIFLSTLFAGLLATSGLAQIPGEDAAKISEAMQGLRAAKPVQERKILVFTRTEGFRHSSIPYAAKAFEEMGDATGAFSVTVSDDMTAFKPENLGQFDGVLFANTTELAFEDWAHRESLMSFVKGGKAVIGIHAATDNFYNWPEAASIMGGTFDGHPWNAGGTWAIKIDDPDHPVTRAFAGQNFNISDEIYRIRQRALRQNARVLLSLDMTDEGNLSANGVRFTDKDLPISWVRNFGKGRVFYSSFGHNHAIYWNPKILQHYLDGIQFALGDLESDVTPLPFDVAGALNFSELDELLAKTTGYNFGDSREHLVVLADFLRFASLSETTRAKVESRLVQALEASGTLAGKQYLCEQISLISSQASIPALAKMLDDSSTFEMARFALERISHPKAADALRNALGKTSGAHKVGLIAALGQIRDRKAVGALQKLINDSDENIVAAVISSLGDIADSKSVSALNKARESAEGARRELASDAMLRAAERLASAKNTADARWIYQKLYTKDESSAVRFAALNGLLKLGDARGFQLLISALKSGDSDLQTSSITLVRDIPASQSISEIIAAFTGFDENAQIQLLGAVASRTGDQETKDLVVSAAGSESDRVRSAAFAALGSLGDASDVEQLAKAAAVRGPSQAAARDALCKVAGESGDAAILSLVESSEAGVQVELIRAIDERRIPGAAPTLLTTAKSDDRRVRLESAKALKNAAATDDLQALVELLISAQSPNERGELEKTVAAVATQNENGGPQTQIILDGLDQAGSKDAKGALLQVLGRIGDDAGLPALREALGGDDETLKTSAIRALMQWPNDSPKNDLLRIAEDSNNQLHQTLALRGFVILLGKSDDAPDERIGGYKKAMTLAGSENEKKTVLSGLAEQKNVAALSMAAGYLDSTALRDEAEIAVVKIAGFTSASAPEETKNVLQRVTAETKNTDRKTNADRIVAFIERFEDFITAWHVAGPYAQEETDLFEHAFAPESGGEADWQIMPASTQQNAPWMAELDRVIGGDNRVAYLRTNVISESEQKVKLELGSDDGVKAWLNDELVHANNVARGVTPGDDVVEIALKAGDNILLLKIVQGGGGWGACARIRNLDGGKAPGVKAALVTEN